MRCAVFVDAGYLFASGAQVLTGSGHTRADTILDIEKAIKHLKMTASEVTDNAQLLRILWYDGMVGGRRSSEQNALARTNDVKLRLGTVTTSGQQKGVDSLIVTDLIDLARNQAISDAVLVSGDADIRVGIELAQKFGARVHLVGITPTGQFNQAIALLEEADTVRAWTKEDIQTFLSVKPTVTADGQASADGPGAIKVVEDDPDAFRLTVDEILDTTTPEELVALSEGLNSNPDSIPQLYDGRLLAGCRNKLDRYLEPQERVKVRTLFKQAIRERINPPATSGESLTT